MFDQTSLYFPNGCDGVLVHSLGCGLCNRIPALACFAAIAEERKIPLWCLWSLDDHCPGTPEEAFEESSLFWKPVNELEFIKLTRTLKAPALFVYAYTSAPVRKFASLAAHPEESYWNEQATRFQKKLRPNASVVAKLEALEAVTVPYERRLGLHVRRTDLAGRGAPGGPKSNGQRDDALNARLDTIADKAEPHSWITCCDNADSLARLQDRYGKRIIHTGAEWKQAGIRGTDITNAALDLYALSRCPLILGTGGSTFSTSAAQIGDCRLEWV